MHFTIQITQRLKKLVRSLHQKTFRDQNQLFVAEGEKLCRELMTSDFSVELLVIKDSPSSDVIEIAEHFADRGVPVYSAPKHQFDQITDTKSPQGALAVVNLKHYDILPGENFIALDGIADPGNLGTIIRTADWFGFKQVILGRDCADVFNPKAVRSTMGSIFRVNVITYPNLPELFANEFKGYSILGASLDSKNSLRDMKIKGNYGLVFGNESRGISDEVKPVLTDDFKISSFGIAESLNVAVAVGISLNHFAEFNSVTGVKKTNSKSL